MSSESAVKVLIVEDDVGYRRIVTFWLQSKGCEVFNAGNLREATEVAKEQNLDVLLTDIGLPDCDGVTLAKRLTERHTIPRVLFMSAVSLERHHDRGIDIDPELFLRKPFTLDELWGEISETS